MVTRSLGRTGRVELRESAESVIEVSALSCFDWHGLAYLTTSQQRGEITSSRAIRVSSSVTREPLLCSSDSGAAVAARYSYHADGHGPAHGSSDLWKNTLYAVGRVYSILQAAEYAHRVTPRSIALGCEAIKAYCAHAHLGTLPLHSETEAAQTPQVRRRE